MCLAVMLTSARSETVKAKLQLPGGIIEEVELINDKGAFENVLIWQATGGRREVIHKADTSRIDHHQWTLEAGFVTDQGISLCRGAASGALEHWRFCKHGQSWSLAARASLGSGTDLVGITMSNLTSLEFDRRGGQKDKFEISDQPLIDNPLYRVVKMNGLEYWPYGRAAGGPTATGE